MTPTDALAAALREAMHVLRCCKWSDTLHGIAHDDEDENRPVWAAAILATLTAAGYTLVPTVELDDRDRAIVALADGLVRIRDGALTEGPRSIARDALATNAATIAAARQRVKA